jgi:hypothetical protein
MAKHTEEDLKPVGMNREGDEVNSRGWVLSDHNREAIERNLRDQADAK